MLELQKSAAEWREKTYPGSEASDIALKLDEEVGEVSGAIFKNKWADADIQNIRDELGDAGLVLMSLCDWFDWDFRDVVRDRARTKGMI